MSNSHKNKPSQLIIFLAVFMLIGNVSGIEKKYISNLTASDQRYMDTQRKAIDDLARRHLGRQLQDNTDNNLSILQALLDQKWVRPEQSQILQSMGVVLGDRLATDLNMQWVILIDGYGRSRALRMGLSENILFPITMISRRVEVGAKVSIRAIYKKSFNIMGPFIQKGPFQY